MAWLKCKAPIVLPHWEEEIAYSGSVVSVVIPYTALYKLEVWGSKGGDTNRSGGYGGYAVGYKLLNKNDILYVCCGGIPYNGGGYATNYYSGDGSYGSNYGGGATHITKTYNTVLTSIGKTNFDAAGLIVAGGGGGASSDWGAAYNPAGGGGGTNGSDGSSPNNGNNHSYPGLGGTQTGPGAALYSGKAKGDFGRGGHAYTNEGTGFRRTAAGGGGGYYGGGGGHARDYPSQGPGGGGSGWIGGVPEIVYKGITYTPSMTNNVNSTTGKAKISLEKF